MCLLGVHLLPILLLGDSVRFSSTLLAFLLALTPFSSNATELLINGVELNGFGIFEATSSRVRNYSGASVGADNVQNVRFVGDNTTDIPGVLKTNFGIQYIVNTTPKGAQFPVTQVIRFPEGGIRQPGGRVHRKSEEKKKVRIGEPTLHGFGFDERWEIVPGEWTFEVYHKKALLLRKVFTVEVPEMAEAS